MMVQGQPLQGTGVLVTRPASQAQHLQQLIEQAGGRVIPFPVIEIAAVQARGTLAGVMQRLGEFHMAIFISANAVIHALALMRAGGGVPEALKIIAIGRGSARELRRQGVEPDIVPQQKFNSEELLGMEEMQQVQGKRIVIFRGEGGRTLLADTLMARGAEVEYAEVYRRVKPAASTDPLMQAWGGGQVNIVTVTSNEGLQNLHEMIGDAGRQLLHRTPLVVVSERARELGVKLGITAEILVAAEASDEAIVSALCEWRHNQRQESMHES